MAEAACLLQPFCHTSDTTPHFDAREGNPIHALGDSISFGRFMSEPLSWEKWSSFNCNRYLEEVEKCSKPGSVAEKKAYFEAHYKKKKAALLDQANSVASSDLESENDHGSCNGSAKNSESFGLDIHSTIDKPGETEISTVKAGISSDVSRYSSNEESGGTETDLIKVIPMLEIPVREDDSMQIKSPNSHEDFENKMVIEEEITPTKQFEKLPLKESCAGNNESSNSTTKTKRSVSSSKLSSQSRGSKVSPSPARFQSSGHTSKENNFTPKSKKIAKDSARKSRLTPQSVHISLNFAPSPSRAGEKNRIATPIRSKTKDSKFAADLTKISQDCLTSLRSPTKASTNPMPKPPSRAGEKNRIATPILRKTKDSKVAADLTKISKDCLTSLRSPTKASTNPMPKPPVALQPESKKPHPGPLRSQIKKALPVTLQLESKRPRPGPLPQIKKALPHLESNRAKPPLGPRTGGTKKRDMKWQSLSTDHSKSSSVSASKACPSSVSSSFSFRTEERAARRKEHLEQLEEKSNAIEAQKMELKAKEKEKAEAELRKLRQTLGFKAKPMPDFSRETQSSNTQIKKIPLTRPRSPKLGRKSCTNSVQGTTSLPPKSPSVKSVSKQPTDKSSRTPTRSANSLPKKNAHENASPNLQK